MSHFSPNLSQKNEQVFFSFSFPMRQVFWQTLGKIWQALLRLKSFLGKTLHANVFSPYEPQDGAPGTFAIKAVKAYCEHLGWTEPHHSAGSWRAFPPQAVISLPVDVGKALTFYLEYSDD